MYNVRQTLPGNAEHKTDGVLSQFTARCRSCQWSIAASTPFTGYPKQDGEPFACPHCRTVLSPSTIRINQ